MEALSALGMAAGAPLALQDNGATDSMLKYHREASKITKS